MLQRSSPLLAPRRRKRARIERRSEKGQTLYLVRRKLPSTSASSLAGLTHLELGRRFFGRITVGHVPIGLFQVAHESARIVKRRRGEFAGQFDAKLIEGLGYCREV